jgi:DUF1680 family protein
MLLLSCSEPAPQEWGRDGSSPHPAALTKGGDEPSPHLSLLIRFLREHLQLMPNLRWLPALMFATLLLPATAVQPQGKRSLEPFDFRGVTLAPGPLKTQVDDAKRFYLAIPDDNLLKGFRARAGRPAPGQDLGGWYSSDTFLVFGQIVSGLSRLYAGTGDVACREKANLLIDEWAKCIEPDGYCYASRKPNAPHYIYDKMLWGVLDDYLYCGNKRALDALSRITDWAIKNLNRSRKINDTSTEWYTLSENLFRAYLATGDLKYRQFAQVWEYHDYWDIYARNGDIFGPRPDGTQTQVYHAYSHVNTLGGAGAGFLVTGEQHYLDVLRNAADYLQAHQCFASGGFGPDEQLLPQPRLIETFSNTRNTFETQCGSWAVFKLAKYLVSFTGDARYGDWVEKLVINGIGTSLPMTKDGHVFYYSDYCPYGGAKHNTDFGWSCCTGTRPQALADYYDQIYFHDARDLYVNLYTPSSVEWTNGRQRIVLTQTTSFPEADEVLLSVQVTHSATFGINFRVPGWVAGPMSASINGRQEPFRRGTNHWARLSRRWRDGDQIELRLPMRPRLASLRSDQLFPAAVMYGPVMLAFTAPSAQFIRNWDLTDLDRQLKPAKRGPLCFDAGSNHAVQARPFYAFGEAERYYVYLDPTLPTRIPHEALQFTGEWHNAGAFRFSNQVDAAVECAFEGSGVRWLGRRFNDAGRAEITIDGQVVAAVDQYGPGRDLPFDWSHRGLAPGRHTIRLRLLPDKPEQSLDRYLNVIGFEAVP